MQIVDVAQPSRVDVQRPAPERAAEGEQGAVGRRPARPVDNHRDGMRAVADVDGNPFGHRGAALEVAIRVLGPATIVLVHHGVQHPVVQGQHVVPARSSHHSATRSANFSGNAAARSCASETSSATW